METKPVKFEGGAHSAASFAQSHFTPHFDSGVITHYPGADYYAVCYGELCAYSVDSKLLAIWDIEVPDCPEDAEAEPDYTGTWEAS